MFLGHNPTTRFLGARIWLRLAAALICLLLVESCDSSKNHLEPYSAPLTAKQKGERAMNFASKTEDDAQLALHFAEAKTQLELALTEEPEQADAIYPLLATAKAGLARLAFYKVLLDGLSAGEVNPDSLVERVLPSEPTQAQVDLLNGAVADLRGMSAASTTNGIKFQTVFYSVLAIRMTLVLVQNTVSSISDISADNAESIINNLDAILEAGLQGEQKEQFQQIKNELDNFGDENATSAEKLAAYCTANPTSEICTSS